MLSKAATARVPAVPMGFWSGLSPVRALGLRRGVALVLVAPVATLLPTSTAHAASTCHGLPATIEASTGTVTGTPGDDVIVVTGSVERVSAEDGDDLVCLVGTGKNISVDPGAGDDEVDASSAGARTTTLLGPGADSFTGSAFTDYVMAGPGVPNVVLADPGPYRVATGAGRDFLDVRPGAVVDAHLGKGADSMNFHSADGVPASQVDLGGGRDMARIEDYLDDPGAGDTSLRVDLTRDLLVWHGVTSMLRGAENISGAAKRIVLHGNRGRNEFWAHGCDVVLKGAAGDDVLSLHIPKADVSPGIPCSPNRLRAYGNAGDDRLQGWRRDDVLIGGPGRDAAFGGGGRDRCEAERTQGCER